MMMADNNNNNNDGLDTLCFDEDDDSDRLCFDIDMLWDIIDDNDNNNNNLNSSQTKPEDSPVEIASQAFPKLEVPPSLGIEGPGSDACSFSYNSEASDPRAGSSEGSSNSAGKSVIIDGENQYYYEQNGTPKCTLSGSFADWKSKKSSYCSEGLTHNLSTENSDITYGSYGDLVDNNSHPLGAPHLEKPATVNASSSSQSAFYTEFRDYGFDGINFPVSENPDAMEFYDQNNIGPGSTYFDPPIQCSTENFSNQYVDNNVEMVAYVNDDFEMLQSHGKCSEDTVKFESSLGITGGTFSAAPDTINSGISIMKDNKRGPDCILPNYRISVDNTDFDQTVAKTYLSQIMPQMTSNSCSNEQAICVKDENTIFRNNVTMNGAAGRNFSGVNDKVDVKKQVFHLKDEERDEWYATQGSANSTPVDLDDVAERKSCEVADGLYTDKGLGQPLTGKLASTLRKSQVTAKVETSDVYFASSKASHSFGKDDSCMIRSPFADGPRLDSSKRPCIKQSKPLVSIKEDMDTRWAQSQSWDSYSLKGRHQTAHRDSWVQKSQVNDDPDICILEDLSEPARRHQPPMNVKLNIPSRSSSLVESHNHIDVGGARLKTKDERLIFRAAVQDIYQPNSEANPPDGLLAVPLLKHQRIALSWMVQKETNSEHCSGGILADDQGLGKTISTIALILKERSPSSKICSVDKQNMDMINLVDDDDDGTSGLSLANQVNVSSPVIKDPSVQQKVRPAAGTLIVCPTSVLRQWSEELLQKVSSKANLSVLTYHGGNRTKDPLELAKYDIVLTTYAIVSMEVPKQPLNDKDDEELGRKSHLQPVGHPSTKKRKYPPSEKSLKGKKGDSEIESVTGPLGKVRWFRIVLDEAQSIKNYKTQVARACWGLRAKRRWCLSGTPIQNSIDDLYSYFRFLKYDPYAVFKYFCSKIKVPIQKSPADGYRKLQAVLKTIMLRRTKGTFLDGEPIINLPPKTIVLKKVDFTMEERDFYTTLEAESRAQFAKYEAAGTVKQNYVNILLMLLRLRQACDHPLLVRGCGSSSAWFSSVEMAKKLSPEKRTSLLNCLEASLAICGICNDPPEDAVVTSCKHVFCNQCICEHLSGVGSVNDYFDTLPSETLQPCSEGGPFDSSKIKAAVEVLQSLSKPQSTHITSSLMTTDGGVHNNQNMDLDSGSSSLVSSVGEKAIVFSQWTRMLDLLEACLKDSSINYRRLDGTMSVLARDKAVKDFNTQPEVTVIIMSLKAASLGLNMVAACHVLLLDLWWNPTTEDQAVDRAHRIGQTRPVSVLRLTVKDTVEDRILALQQKKREMVASAFGEDETGSRQTRLTVEDLQYLFNV
ncbi:putative SWI/SNF-related matrix-associated actin-dependent regulator of chromatin subfamily A member 3-like 2 [Heracleum sosnowskyi]|uniref:SWI/SNF-related matrix-associated actin-dependent regulator of chromatin subfamily A member 3-like 2 n=1 Tax=Heracleum sosnowskyi TaxID=360622 RepID=A0AAD8HYX9_9APIA|nr:putative SWI/SNF-related matrix-associated actin-dependent regulator of chromatin subfamily A member 3-like 2 [Heracleum sosnowskyi]